ncbi:MAG: M20 family metallopeptidase [Planctomycetes bacterium]|nr:M20 family metallopeptidase [Planctomycetota bacterium]
MTPATATHWLDRHREQLLAFAARLIATPSPNPPGDERAVVHEIVTEMHNLGLSDTEIAAKVPERPNLIYRLRGGKTGPVLMLCGHSDTKPVGQRGEWRTDPFEPVIHDGKLYGLGATDMKGAVAAMVYATAALRQSAGELAGDLLLVIDADEERSMKFGAEYLAGEYGLRADVALLGEPSGIAGPEFEFLHLVSRGVACFKVRVHGTQTHSSLTDRLSAVNANQLLAEVITRMQRELQLTFRPHPLCSAPTINLAVQVEGGVGYGVCPGVAEFQSDIRTLPGMTRAQVEDDLEKCLNGIRRYHPRLRVELQFEELPLGWIAPTEVSADHPLVPALLRSAEEVLGRRPTLSAFPGGSDAAKFQGLAGIPTIPSFGPGWLNLAHGPNECVGVAAILQAAHIYVRAAATFLA